MTSPRILRWLWIAAGCAIALALGREPLLRLVPAPRELPRLDGATGQPWINEGFAARNDAQPFLPPGIQHASSGHEGDDWTGRAETAWFRTSRRTIHVGVSGHPQNPRCTLWVEFKHRDETVSSVVCRIPDPGIAWNTWEIARPESAVAVRVLAEDNARGPTGWIAFSHPFRAWPGWIFAAYQFLQVVTTTALALTLVWGPGLLLSSRARRDESRAAILLGAGPLALVGAGILVWVFGIWLPVRAVGSLLVIGLWVAIGIGARRESWTLINDRPLRLALAVSALIATAVVSRSSYSVGPPGELYRGMVSRNLELSDRIDSRFSFYIVQAAAHHWSPASPKTESFFYPWTFFSRGPLAGLAAIPVVMATQGHPPEVLPENRWSPFDHTGFAAYRITMIVLASAVILALFRVLRRFAGDDWALIAAGLLALSPFGVHEIMFTWPKWPATVWVLVSFSLAHARRPVAAGVALGFGFLFHPLALLWAPWIGLWAGARAYVASPTAQTRALIVAGVRCTLGACALVLPWMALGALMPHAPDTPFAGQGGFLKYWARADWQIATWDTWWRTRWMNFANTFLPLHLYLDAPSFTHPKLGSQYEASTDLVKFSQVWWNTLPFALGLGLWVACLAAVARAARELRAVFWLFIVFPAGFTIAYWGMDPLGLMRECGHPFFVTLIGLSCVLASRHAGALRTTISHPVTPWLQLPETGLMLWLTTWLNTSPRSVEHPHLDPVYLGINVITLAAVAALLARARTSVPPVPAATAAHPTVTRNPVLQHRRHLPAGAWVILAVGVMALVIGPDKRAVEGSRPLVPIEGGWSASRGDFVPNGVFSYTRSDELPQNIATRGSWVEGDEFVGRHDTGWFKPAPRFTIMVSGYPHKPGNRLELETRSRDGTLRRVAYDGPDVGERWQHWQPKLDGDVEAFRIHGSDAHTSHGGWFAFSEPFTAYPIHYAIWWNLLQLTATSCLALAVIVGPGLLWFGAKERPLSHLAYAILPGPLLLALLGLTCWALGGAFQPMALARFGVALLLAWITWRGAQHRGGTPLPTEVRTLLAVLALLVGFAVAKANVSFGPTGELFRGLVSRTLAVGGHSDSQISFHTVQVVAHHLSPSHAQTRRYYDPWRFASRGPLAGLMAAPIVLATGADVPFHHPTQPWRPYDRQGFSVYRIACITLAALSVFAVFGTVAGLTNPAWGMLGAIVAALAPFFIHEIYFTWPKLIAGALVVVSFLALHQRRPFLAGALVALGYLYHPLAALSAPFLGLWSLCQSAPLGLVSRIQRGAWFAAGALVLVIPWQIIGRMHTDGHVDQKVFLTYFLIADNAAATWPTWWQSRWDNFANTFLPGYLLTIDPTHESINSFYHRSDVWVRTSFLWWNTLPLALGLPAFAFVAGAFARATRRAFATIALLILLPAILLIAYWGAASSGLMRQCGHALFISVIVGAAWSAATFRGKFEERVATALLHPACFAWRGFEIALMAFGTTLLNQRPDLDGAFGLNDSVSLVVSGGCLAAAVILLAKAARSLRSQLFTTAFPS